MEKRYGTLPSVRHYTEAPPTRVHLLRGRGFVHRKVKGKGEQLEAQSQWPDTCETGGKFFLQRGDNTNTSVQVHVIRCTNCNTKKMHKLTSSQLSLPQSQAMMCEYMCGTRMFLPCSLPVVARTLLIVTHTRRDRSGECCFTH